MTFFLKALCVGTYLLGLASVLGLLPPALGFFGTVGAVLLALHVLELPFTMKYLKRYPGPLAVSVLLTLLFGFVHWMPLRKQATD